MAVAWTDSTSKAIVDSGVQIIAAGNVNVKAAGDVKSEATATTAIYLSGTVGAGAERQLGQDRRPGNR